MTSMAACDSHSSIPAQATIVESVTSRNLHVSDAQAKDVEQRGIVVLLHSGTQSEWQWAHQQPALVAAGFRVIAYSRRGYAPSPFSTSTDVRHIGSDDLHHLLVEHLALPLPSSSSATTASTQVHLVGSAQGGWYALDYALSFPEDVASLTLLSSQLNLCDPDWLARCDRLKPSFFAALPADFKELSPSYRAGNPKGHDQWLDLHHRAFGETQPSIAQMQHTITYDRLSEVRCPVLLCTGDADLYVPPSLLRIQAIHFQQVDIAIITESGHSAYWENPEAFNTLLLAFLSRNYPSSPST